MAQLIDTNNQDWQPIRPELTTGIAGKLLLEGPIKMVLTKVDPGGFFALIVTTTVTCFTFFQGRHLCLEI